MEKFLSILSTLSTGDRVVIPKSGVKIVQHHGIFLGYSDGRYIFIENKDGIGVRVVTAQVFFAGVNEVTRVNRFVPKQGYSRHDLYRYALSKKGRAYNLLSYNCEHFANEIQHRVVKSKQADTGLFLGFLALIIGIAAAGSNNNSKKR